MSETRRKAKVDVVDLVDLRGKRSTRCSYAATPTTPLSSSLGAGRLRAGNPFSSADSVSP
jgi:hypothetical protein